MKYYRIDLYCKSAITDIEEIEVTKASAKTVWTKHGKRRIETEFQLYSQSKRACIAKIADFYKKEIKRLEQERARIERSLIKYHQVLSATNNELLKA